MAGRFDGKVAVVTGGASGIGEAIVRRYVQEGGSVVAGDINEERLESLAAELGDRCRTLRVDVTQEKDCEALVAAAVEAFGGLDAGFNVAGAARGALIQDISEEDWDFTVDLCLKGVMFSMKHEARQLLEQGRGGAIIHVSSLNSQVPMFGGVAYCAAKAGAAMLAQCGALEFGEYGIRVNAISPGLTDTPLTAATKEIPGAREAYMDRIPMKRAALPEDIAAASLFLATDDAEYISGVNLFVDGAWAQSGYPDMRPFRPAMAAARGR